MSSMTVDEPARKVIVGVDTHKHIHVAVAIDHHGARLGDLSVDHAHRELPRPAH